MIAYVSGILYVADTATGIFPDGEFGFGFLGLARKLGSFPRFLQIARKCGLLYPLWLVLIPWYSFVLGFWLIAPRSFGSRGVGSHNILYTGWWTYA